MPIDPHTQEFRPLKRDPEGRHCDKCRRIFAENHVPEMNVHGQRICMDCQMAAPQPHRRLF